MPGYDRATKEIVRTFAVYGYNAVCPNLFHRYAPGSKAADAAAAAREAGGVPDAQCVGDVAGAAEHLRSLPTANGKIGVIGYCSGGRQAYLVACTLPLDAAVDCYGGRVVAGPDDLSPARPVAPIDLTPKLSCPLLGLFGAEDHNPSPEDVRGSRTSCVPTARRTSSTPTRAPVTRSSRSTARATTSTPRRTGGSRSGAGSAATSRTPDVARSGQEWGSAP